MIIREILDKLHIEKNVGTATVHYYEVTLRLLMLAQLRCPRVYLLQGSLGDSGLDL
jgi:hypothetical protein